MAQVTQGTSRDSCLSLSLLTQLSLGFPRLPSESSPQSGGHATRACFLAPFQPASPRPPAAVNPASCSPGGHSAVPDGCVALPRVVPSLGRAQLAVGGRPWAGHRGRAHERGRGGKEGQRSQEQGGEGSWVPGTPSTSPSSPCREHRAAFQILPSPSWGGPGRAAGVSPGLSPCTQAGQGALAPPAAVKVGKETQSSTPTALYPPGQLVC